MNDIYFKALNDHPEYAVTIDGDIYHYFRTVGFKRLHPYDVNGNQYVNISGKATNVGAMVLETFVANKMNDSFKPYHLNGVSNDNRIENLEWASRSEMRSLSNVIPANRREALTALRDGDTEAFERFKEDQE